MAAVESPDPGTACRVAWPSTASPAALTPAGGGTAGPIRPAGRLRPGPRVRPEQQPQDLAQLDQAIDEATDQATGWLGGPARTGAAPGQAGVFLGSVIVTTVAGARWRLCPNGHPVVRLASGRDRSRYDPHRSLVTVPAREGRSPASAGCSLGCSSLPFSSVH